ncbi:MAG: superoxide dismutase [Candidatus Pacebacteria bacterium]|nr:superoxide dismutase [Candidatus Paceibacterota bacterium]
MKKQTLPKLPYSYQELEPAISARIMKLHHDKHHAGYVKKANAALKQLQTEQPNYKQVLKDLSFNLNGHILHSVFWQNMRAYQQNNAPTPTVKKQLAKSFGSFANFKQSFNKTATSVEGSGWGALLKSPTGELQLMQLENHNKLFLNNFSLVLVVDVWEHAYYLDYENNRGQYLQNWWQVVNWDDVAKRLAD